MGKTKKYDLKSLKVHQSLASEKHATSQQNGRTEISLHNRILRSQAKARQF